MSFKNYTLLQSLFLTSCLIAPVTTYAQDAEQPEEVDEIIVTGRRLADRAALAAKRAADGQMDQIKSDDVGKLPDQNVAEAVGRLPGVSVDNDQGEGRYLTIRGVSPDMLNVTLNGATAAAPEPESRQVKLDDIPSGLIGAVTVVKTLTPDRDANAIAGQVDIETVTAFDKGRPFANVRAAYGYNDINDANPYEGDASIGRIFGKNDQFGAVFALNHSSRTLGSQNFQSGASWEEVNGFDVPLEQTLRMYNTTRKRTGAVANFDWHPTDNARTFLRFLYSVYDDTEKRPGFTLALDEDEITDQSASTGSFMAAESERALRSRTEKTNTLTGSIGGDFDFGENWLGVEATYTRAEKNDPNRDEWIFIAEDITGSYDLGGDKFKFTPDASAYDPSNFEFDEIGYENREAVENLFQAKIDYRHAISFGDDSSIKVGAKIISREKSSDENAMIYDGYDGSDLTLDMFLGEPIDSIFDGDYRFGATVNSDAANAFFMANQGDFELDEEASVGDSLAADYLINETITAAYFMTTLKSGDWTVIPGVRFEHTKSDYSAKAVLETLALSEINKDYDSFGDQNYSDWFPGVNVRYDVAENLVLRGAVTRAIGRANYEQLAPTAVVNTSDNEVELGNPNLKPRYSTNFDAAIEYYLGNKGIISAAIFHKEITNPIYSATTEETGVYAGQDLVDAEVTRPVNADEATVTGLEMNAQYELSFLPVPLDGLSASGSLTLVDSEASGIPGRTDTLPLAQQSDTVASASLSYEKDRFAGRIAYTYRSDKLLEPGEDTYSDIYVGAFNQFDAQVSYAILENIKVYIEGSNLNDEPMVLYQGIRNRLDEVERYGWSSKIGIQATF